MTIIALILSILLGTASLAMGYGQAGADVYSRWHPGNPGGVSEEIIGRWMRARANRGAIVLATKARGRMWEGPNGEGLSRAHLIRACDDSLRRLQTDYIDLYQTHSFDAETPKTDLVFDRNPAGGRDT